MVENVQSGIWLPVFGVELDNLGSNVFLVCPPASVLMLLHRQSFFCDCDKTPRRWTIVREEPRYHLNMATTDSCCTPLSSWLTQRVSLHSARVHRTSRLCCSQETTVTHRSRYSQPSGTSVHEVATCATSHISKISPLLSEYVHDQVGQSLKTRSSS